MGYKKSIQQVSKKIPNLILINTKVKTNHGREYFFYYKFYIFTNDISLEEFIFHIGKENIKLDIRMHLDLENNNIRDHGSAFRCSYKSIFDIFPLYKMIL